MSTTRRSFLGGMGGLGAAAGLGAAGTAFAAPVRGKAAPASDRIRVGVIGCRGMGSSDMGSMLEVDGVECAALCDVDRNVLDKGVEGFEKLTDSKPDAYGDYRKLLEDDEIDAVIIGAPDHWHCKIMVDACEAGKDVYVEKPMANSIEEVRIMQRAAKAYGRVVQVGQRQRSGKHWQDAMEYLWSGELGQIRTAKAWAYMGWDAPMPVPDSKPPKGVDYDMWLGPARKRPFNERECMKSREQPRCNPDVGALAAVNAHLGNIAFRTGRRVYWDHAAGRFKDDDEANALLVAEYHNGWQLPQVSGAEASAG